jgi:acyl-CoA synthetase (AMP-forming)/AMP-acid ligase II
MEYLSQILASRARELPDRPFLIQDGTSLSYAGFAAETARLAQVLAEMGVGKGDRVGLYLPSRIIMATAFWACQRLGAVPAPLSAMLRHDELRRLLVRADLKAMIADPDTHAYFAPLAAEFPGLPCLVADAALAARMAALPGSFADVPCSRSDIAAIFFTSGTTGTPKGIAQPQMGHVSTMRDMMVSHRARYGAEVYLCAVPLFTNFGLTVTLNLGLYTGGTVVLHERWDTARVLDDISRYRATYFGGTPTMYVYLTNDFDPARHDLSSLRVCTTGGAPVPQSVVARFEGLSGARVTQVYGSTETLGQNVMEPTLGIRKPGSAGLAVGASRIAIVDDAGSVLPAGQIGEVVIGGDCVAASYFRAPEDSARAFGPLGWASGDLGYLDEDGYLFIVDRKKDVIFAGGHNIYPIEVETVLYRHPDVAVCAVVPRPDPRLGEIPVAVVVPKPGTAPEAEALRHWLREHLAAYKIPREVHFVDRMPVEAAKIRKRDLVEALKSGTLDRFRGGG